MKCAGLIGVQMLGRKIRIPYFLNGQSEHAQNFQWFCAT